MEQRIERDRRRKIWFHTRNPDREGRIANGNSRKRELLGLPGLDMPDQTSLGVWSQLGAAMVVDGRRDHHENTRAALFSLCRADTTPISTFPISPLGLA